MPEESQNTPVPQENKPSVLNNPVPNPLAKNPNFFTHKVFAAIGLILIGAVLILFGLVFFYHVNLADLFYTVPVADNSNNATNSATISKTSATAGWKTYQDGTYYLKYPANWSAALSTTTSPASVLVKDPNGQIQIKFGKGLVTSPDLGPGENVNSIGKTSLKVDGKDLEFVEANKKNDGAWYFYHSVSGDIYIEAYSLKIPNSQSKTTVETIIQTFKDVSNETAGWKTFRSSSCGFTVKYPQDWQVAKDVSGGSTLANLEQLDTNYISVGISCDNNSANTDLYNNVKTYEVGKSTQVKPIHQVSNEVDTYTRLSDSNVDGYKAVRTKVDFGYKDMGVGDSYDVFIMRNNTLYVAKMTYSLTLDEKVKLLDRILSTFKFL